MPNVDRRHFLKLAAAMGATLAWGCSTLRPSSSGWRERRDLYSQGVASGDPEDIRKTDAKMKELFPEDAHLHRWLDMAGERIAFQGLPARICWIGLGERHRAGLAFNEMVKSGELKAPAMALGSAASSATLKSEWRCARAIRFIS